MRFPIAALTAIALIDLAANVGAAAPADVYPSKPIRLIVPTVPGVPPDVVARILGEKLSSALGQVIVAENKPGAIGTIGLQALARAVPDGYTLGILSMPFIVGPVLLPHVRYDTARDLAPVTLLCWNYNLLAVPAKSTAQTTASLFALAGKRPGAVTYASAGNGTPGHFAGELISRELRLNITHLPYKGGAAAAVALIAGEADMYVGSVASLTPFISTGRLRALATIAPQRLASHPGISTLIEQGYTKLEITDWQAVAAPAATPQTIIARLNSEIGKILETPDVRQRLETLGMPVAGWGPERFTPYLLGEIQRWSKLVHDAGIKAE